MAEKSRVFLATGSNAGALATAANAQVSTQLAAGYVLAKTQLITATAVLLHFLERPPEFSPPLFVGATGSSTANAVAAIGTNNATQEAAGYTLMEIITLSSSSFLLRFDLKVLP